MMRHLLLPLLGALLIATPVRSQAAPGEWVFVEGGTFQNANSNYHDRNVTVSSFYIGKFEVTQKEWVEVMGRNPSQFQGDNLPVENVTWYEAVEYCNRRSVKEGRQPYYTIDQTARDPTNDNPEDDVRWTVTIVPEADGYRLPTEAEWEYAASGGQASRSHTYSGADEIDLVAWYWQNSGDQPLAGAWNWPAIERNRNQTKPVGGKQPNELGIHDMSGNVREWCWDWRGEIAGGTTDPKGADRGWARVWKGGGWLGGDFCCAISYRSEFEPHSKGPDQGLRLCRNQ